MRIRKLACFSNYVDAREAYTQQLSRMGDREHVARLPLLEIEYQQNGVDVVMKYSYIPVRVNVDLDRICDYKGLLDLEAVRVELFRQVNAIVTEMWDRTAQAEVGLDGIAYKTVYGDDQAANTVAEHGGAGEGEVSKV